MTLLPVPFQKKIMTVCAYIAYFCRGIADIGDEIEC